MHCCRSEKLLKEICRFVKGLKLNEPANSKQFDKLRKHFMLFRYATCLINDSINPIWPGGPLWLGWLQIFSCFNFDFATHTKLLDFISFNIGHAPGKLFLGIFFPKISNMEKIFKRGTLLWKNQKWELMNHQ